MKRIAKWAHQKIFKKVLNDRKREIKVAQKSVADLD